MSQPASDKLEDIRRAANDIYNNGITSNEIVTRAFLPLLRKATAPRVIMISSARGSIGRTTAKEVSFHRITLGGRRRRNIPLTASVKLPPVAAVSYCVAKAALNMLTVHLQQAEDGRDDGEGAKVAYWAVSPGHCKTAFNGYRGRKRPEDGAEVVARLLEAASGEVPAGTFWECENGVMAEVKW